MYEVPLKTNNNQIFSEIFAQNILTTPGSFYNFETIGEWYDTIMWITYFITL